MKKINRGVTFYPEVPIGCTKCEKPTGLLLTAADVLCARCYNKEPAMDCVICTGVRSKAPIYWVCGVHYEDRERCCELFELTEEKKKEILSEYANFKGQEKLVQDLDVIRQMLQELTIK